ncbi:MAG: hypothetical protein HRU33_17825 [Rhodobacteraceae bacterium]|nr:hypothetical protein [Paracoccaceae bacterium]
MTVEYGPFLHIGPGKSGTTTLQKFLSVNRETLRGRGYLVPKSPGPLRHFKLLLYEFNDKRTVKQPSWKNRNPTPADFRREFSQQFADEIRSCGLPKVILSDEGLCRLNPNEIRRLQSLLSDHFDKITIISYLRRQDDHVTSRYQQVVKTGGSVLTFSEYLKGRHPQYLYADLLARWAEVFGREALVPRIFDKQAFFGGSLIADFLSCVGLHDAANFEDVKTLNTSLDAASTEFLRRYKMVYKEHKGRDLHPLGQDASLITFLGNQPNRGKLKLTGKRRKNFMSRWDATNAEVARTYFDKPDGQLFSAPEAEAGDRSEENLNMDVMMALFFQEWDRKRGNSPDDS